MNRIASSVTRHLYLQMPGAFNELLYDQVRPTERRLGLAHRGLDGGEQTVETANDADSSTATARGRLQHDRQAHALANDAVHAACVAGTAFASTNHRHPGLLGLPLRRPFVGKAPH